MDPDPMSAEDFAAWVDHMQRIRAWSKTECARRLGAGKNQLPVWCERGAPPYIGYACAALAAGLPPWQTTRRR